MKSGWIVLDKPKGLTSSRAGFILRKIFGAKTVGHLGTLDPMATGVLVVALGEATKMIPYIAETPKEYVFQIQFGQSRDTDDAEGRVILENDNRPTLTQILEVLPKFIGNIEQIPPAYSAIHIDGKRAYDLARKGVEVDMPKRTVRIDELEVFGVGVNDLGEHRVTEKSLPIFRDVLDFDVKSGVDKSDEKILCRDKDLNISKDSTVLHSQQDVLLDSVMLRVVCGGGTYVRSLARDVSAAVGCLGYVDVLRRTMSNGFKVEFNSEKLGMFSGCLEDVVPIKNEEITKNGRNWEKCAIKLEKSNEVDYHVVAESLDDSLIPIDAVLGDIPVMQINGSDLSLFLNGGMLPIADKGVFRTYCEGRFLGIAVADGEFVHIVRRINE